MRRSSGASLPLGLPAENDGGLNDQARKGVGVDGVGAGELRSRLVQLAVHRHLEMKSREGKNSRKAPVGRLFTSGPLVSSHAIEATSSLMSSKRLA